ncbi:hypothetical protein N0V93_001154 [Gnomoniopsis smithogilvyi]|uniref:Uncharacterized protein n=1 Tax=Gnomoniopsis smithogilvyi TaxID=1191159 RepID=A0A9W9D0X8_9PEZI|nr:hypothetical protein N0V93_001154 [Gnomoniopsis smithogilvyi]
MDPSTAAETSEPQVVFRPSKRRKQFRQRAEENDNTADDATGQTGSTPSTTEGRDPRSQEREDDGISNTEGLSVAEVLRLRNARKSKLKGVEFRPEGPSKDGVIAEPSPAPKDDVSEALELGMSRRFAPQAGLVGELVNKHMEEYIESELARRHAADKAAQEAQSQNPESSSTATPSGAQLSKHQEERPTMQGRLQEVDLGDEVRARNAAMTEQARRRLAGETIEDESDGSRKRPRVGKDGKPWRGRKRRASDVKRDQMVEALMRENRLDIYDPPPQVETTAQPGTDEAADERIAEEFRREFMDAMAERRNQRRKAPAAPVRPGAKQEEVLKGPKLGGSRNARAAMRDLLLSQQEKDKKRR